MTAQVSSQLVLSAEQHAILPNWEAANVFVPVEQRATDRQRRITESANDILAEGIYLCRKPAIATALRDAIGALTTDLGSFQADVADIFERLDTRLTKLVERHAAMCQAASALVQEQEAKAEELLTARGSLMAKAAAFATIMQENASDQ